MCGIIGIASGVPAADRRWLAAGRDAMRHRGPDDAGEWWSEDGRVGLGHRRLSIIDLSPAGHQPMPDLPGGLRIVFNGEIYNFAELRRDLAGKGHRFASDSDTEVILAAYREWSTDCVQRLNGMFVFAIHDSAKQLMFIARDRAGEKPLFYRLDGGALVFASELKGLMAHPGLERRIDPHALDCLLGLGFIPGDLCILRGVKKLPPAHALAFNLGNGELRLWAYWTLPPPPAPVSASPEQALSPLLEEMERLLEDAVRHQLVAHVPVGVLLSGGVDSSLVTAMAVRAAPQVKTFTVRFPSFGRYDESEHARLIARHFKTEHLELDAGETPVDLLPTLARQFCEPLVDSSMIPTYLVSKLVREHCTVALGGDGGDELFGGYYHYSRLLWMQQKFAAVPRFIRASVAWPTQALLPIGVKGRNWIQALATDLSRDVPLVNYCFDASARSSLLAGRRSLPRVAEQIRKQGVPHVPGLLDRATRTDFLQYLPEDILVKVDRASMLASLEMRAPLLDYRIIEFAFGKVPQPLRATANSRKVLLRHLAQRILPEAFQRNRKQGFEIPLPVWLRSGPWREYFREVLLGSKDGLFDRRAATKLLDGQDLGRMNSERLFALVVFELWRREYRAFI